MTPIDAASFVGNWLVALPGLAVAATAFLLMTVDLMSRAQDRDGLAAIGILGLGVTVAVSVWLWSSGTDPSGFQNMLRADRYGLFFSVVIAVAAAFSILMSVEYLHEHRIPVGDYHALLLLSTCGMVFMATSNDLVVTFVALEIMSVGVYVLAGMLRGDRRSHEAAMKYFLLGAFASGFLLYGIAFFYGASGSTRLDVIAQAIARDGLTPYMLLGIAFVTIGFGFKVALVPFQAWTPDVYEGAPTTVTAFMAVGVKAAAFAALGRVFWTSLHGVSANWTMLLAVLAVLTMTIGNVVAISQRSVKRMLAYSSIAHAGYALMGVVAATREGGAALLFYLAVYACMNVGAFGVLLALGRRGEPNEHLEDLAGVGFRQPLLGVAMLVFMLSLAGVPPTAGFAGKFYLFSAAIDAGWIWLAVLGVVNSVISVWYYLGVVVQMYMVEGTVQPASPFSRPCLLATIVLALIGTMAIGLFPGGSMQLAADAFASLR